MKHYNNLLYFYISHIYLVGIHADPAAVNINVWLTPDESQITGGGLEVFKMIPPADVTVTKVNHEFTSREEEAEFYKCVDAYVVDINSAVDHVLI